MSSDTFETSHTILEHPGIGKIQGIRRPNGLSQFLGVQYATLKDGYARGELKPPNPEGVLDATQHG